MSGCPDARARYAPDGPTQSQVATAPGVVDLHTRLSGSSRISENVFLSSSSSNDDASGSESGAVFVHEETQDESKNESQPGDVGDEYTRNYYGSDDEANLSNTDEGAKDSSASAKAMSVEMDDSDKAPMLRQRFGPEEDYLLAIQVNANEPYTAKHGDIRRSWEELADKLNNSPNFNMLSIKGTTAQVRFKRRLDVHRTWENTPARKSSTDVKETHYIQIMTEPQIKVNDIEAVNVKRAAANAEQQQTKVQSGEVVRQEAVSRIKLGKRNPKSDASGEEAKENSPPNRKKGCTDWENLFKEAKEQRAQVLESFMKMQQAGQQQRLDFEREQREKDRMEREKEREERRLEREERLKDCELQGKLIASLLQHFDKKNG